MADDCEFDVALPSLGKKTRELRCVSPERMAELLAAEVERDALAASLAAQVAINRENVRKLGKLLPAEVQRKHLAAVIEQVRVLHADASPWCGSFCVDPENGSTALWPCPTAALLPVVSP